MHSRAHRAVALAATLATAALVSAGGGAAADGAIRPDDRSTHGPGAVTTQIASVVRPDDRADRHLPGSQAAVVAPTTAEAFDWADAGIGALATLGAVIVVGGAATIGLRRRPELA